MHTPEQWWTRIKTDEDAFIDWMRRQYHGEVGASGRIRAFADLFAEGGPHEATLRRIADEEEQHAAWFAGLLRARGIEPVVLDAHDERYWNQTLPGIDSFETGAAVAAHAEEMRLARIRVIAADADAPGDVRDVLGRILEDEVGHAEAFRAMTTDEAYAATSDAHALGLEALGLTV